MEVAATRESTARRRRWRRRAGLIVVISVVTAGAGCTAADWPSLAAGRSSPTSSSSSSSTSTNAVAINPPAVTHQQFEQIVSDAKVVQDAADEARDAEALKTRFDSPALEARAAYYSIVARDPAAPKPASIPDGSIVFLVPQQTSTWPRHVFAVVQDASRENAVSVVATQASARENYRVESLTRLAAEADLPKVVPAKVGSPVLDPDVKLLRARPIDLAPAYGELLAKGSSSASAGLFDSHDDELESTIGKAYRDAKVAKLPTTAGIVFSQHPNPAEPVSFGTRSGGAIVAATLDETETVTPKKPGAEVNPEGEVKALSGVSTSQKGIASTYRLQLLFAVPPVGSPDTVHVLGFEQALVSSEEVT